MRVDEHQALLTNLGRFVDEPALSDVTFVVGEQGSAERVHGCRAVLALQSDVFRELLCGRWKEGSLGVEVHLPQFEPQAFRALARFLHTGEVELDGESACDLYACADYFGVSSLRAHCQQFMRSNITEATALPFLLCYLLHGKGSGLSQLEAMRCRNFIKLHAETLLKDPRAMLLPRAVFFDILEADSTVASELSLFQAVVRWAQEHPDDAEAAAGFIRLGLIPAKELLGTVLPSGLFSERTLLHVLSHREDPACIELPSSMMRSRLSEPFRKSFMKTSKRRAGPRAAFQDTQDGGAVMCMGAIVAHYGRENDNKGNVLNIITDDSSVMKVHLPFGTCGSAPATDGLRYVYVFESLWGKVYGNGFGRVDVATGAFERLPDMPGRRRLYCSSCVQSGCVWALLNGDELAAFDTATFKWEVISTEFPKGHLLADPFDDSTIWVMREDTALDRFCIRTCTSSTMTKRPHEFPMGDNYPAFILPFGSSVVATYCKAQKWHLFDTLTQQWIAASWLPDVRQGGHCFWDVDHGRAFFQVQDSEFWEVVEPL